MEKIKGIKIRNLSLLAIITCMISLSFFSSIVEYMLHKDDELKKTEELLYYAAVMAEATLPANYHDEIFGPNSVSPLEYEQIVNRYNRLCTELDIDYIWSLMLIDNLPVFTSATSPDKQVSNALHAAFFHQHENPDLYNEVFRTMKCRFQNNTDKKEPIRAVLVPHYDIHGRKYIFGAGKKLQDIKNASTHISTNALTTILVLLLPCTIIGLLVSNWLTRPIAKLSEMAQKMGEGNFNDAIPTDGFYEHAVVATQLENMRLNIRSTVNGLQNTMQQLNNLRKSVNASPAIFTRLRIEETLKPDYFSDNIDITGFSAQQIISGKIGLSAFVPPIDLERNLVALQTAIAQNQDNYSQELRLILADGSIRWHENWGSFLKDETGKITHVQGFLIDIEERKIAREHDQHTRIQLESTMTKLKDFHNIVTSSPVLLYVVKYDKYQTTEFISDNYSELGHNIEDLRSGALPWNQIVPLEDQKRTAKIIEEAIKSNKDSYSTESRMIWANGEVHWYKTWNQIIKDETGTAIQIRGIQTDITPLKESLHALQSFQQIVNSSPSIIYRLRFEPNIWPVEFISENVTELLGYSKENLLSGKTRWHDLNYSDDIPLVDGCIMDKVKNNIEEFKIESRIQTASGEIRYMESWNRFERDKTGKITHVTGLFKDITEQKQAQDKEQLHLEQLNTTLTELRSFEQIVSESPFTVFKLDVRNNFSPTFISENISIIGHSPSNIISGIIDINSLMPAHDKIKHRKHFIAAIRSNEDRYSLQTHIQWANGEQHPYQHWFRIIKDTKGKPKYLQGISYDVTERKEADERDHNYRNRLKGLAQDLVAVEDRERGRLAIALHDDLGQMLAALNMKFSVLKESENRSEIDNLVVQVEDLMHTVMKTCKTLTWEISPTSLYETDIAAGLERMVGDLNCYFDLDVHIGTAGSRIEVDKNSAALIFRTAKELLVNIAKHSGTKVADLGISQYENKVHMVISDQGKGFDTASLSQNAKGGFGLFSIRERLEHICGSMHIESDLNKGTKIMMIIPFNPYEKQDC